MHAFMAWLLHLSVEVLYLGVCLMWCLFLFEEREAALGEIGGKVFEYNKKEHNDESWLVHVSVQSLHAMSFSQLPHSILERFISL